jgi:hypothetical protein
MKEAYILERANEYVSIKEAFYMDNLFGLYNEAQRNGDDEACEKLLTEVEKEDRRQSPKDKYDEEEVEIALIVKRGKHNAGTPHPS